jgi:hypothetical protein
VARKGNIKVALGPEAEVAVALADAGVEVVAMPDKAILDAGVAKFREYACLHWPTGKPGLDEKFKLASFDWRNDYHLRVTIGMVYMAMSRAADAAEDTADEPEMENPEV